MSITILLLSSVILSAASAESKTEHDLRIQLAAMKVQLSSVQSRADSLNSAHESALSKIESLSRENAKIKTAEAVAQARCEEMQRELDHARSQVRSQSDAVHEQGRIVQQLQEIADRPQAKTVQVHSDTKAITKLVNETQDKSAAAIERGTKMTEASQPRIEKAVKLAAEAARVGEDNKTLLARHAALLWQIVHIGWAVIALCALLTTAIIFLIAKK